MGKILSPAENRVQKMLQEFAEEKEERLLTDEETDFIESLIFSEGGQSLLMNRREKAIFEVFADHNYVRMAKLANLEGGESAEAELLDETLPENLRTIFLGMSLAQIKTGEGLNKLMIAYLSTIYKREFAFDESACYDFTPPVFDKEKDPVAYQQAVEAFEASGFKNDDQKKAYRDVILDGYYTLNTERTRKMFTAACYKLHSMPMGVMTNNPFLNRMINDLKRSDKTRELAFALADTIVLHKPIHKPSFIQKISNKLFGAHKELFKKYEEECQRRAITLTNSKNKTSRTNLRTKGISIVAALDPTFKKKPAERSTFVKFFDDMGLRKELDMLPEDFELKAQRRKNAQQAKRKV